MYREGFFVFSYLSPQEETVGWSADRGGGNDFISFPGIPFANDRIDLVKIFILH